MAAMTTDRSRLLPPLPDHQIAERHALLADLLHTYGRHAAFSHISTHQAAPHCHLAARLRLAYAYNTDEAVDIMRTLATLTERPGQVHLWGPRARGVRTVRDLTMDVWHGPLGAFHVPLVQVHVEVTIDTTGTEKRHDELVAAAEQAERAAAGTAGAV